MRTMPPVIQPAFREVEGKYADLTGANGIALRHRHYAPYFLRLGRDVVIEEGCRFFHPERIVLEDDARIGPGAVVDGSGGLWIGRHARVGPHCFIYCVDHDSAEGPMAFHESNYNAASVRIGDNVLISANVTLMPGAQIGDGCFITAGALVPGEVFAPRARLYGVPAKMRPVNRAQHTEKKLDAPEIAILVPRTRHWPDVTKRFATLLRQNLRPGPTAWRDVAHHLLTCLGLPQVAVFEAGSPLPASVHSVVIFGPEAWVPRLRSKQGRDLWRLITGSAPNGGPSHVVLESGEHFEFPAAHAVGIIADRREGANSIDRIQQTLFWLGERFFKGSRSLSRRDHREWQLLLRLMGTRANHEGGIFARIAASLDQRRPETDS